MQGAEHEAFQKGWVKIALKYIALAELQNQTSQYLQPNTVILHCNITVGLTTGTLTKYLHH